MKSLLVFALLASAAALAADTTPLAGKWKIHSSIAGNESDGECTLTQKDNQLGGSCKTTDGKDSPAVGSVDGTKITWSFESEYNGTALTITYTGTLDAVAGKVSGNVNVEPFGVDGEFTATAVK
jgi:hypothetical protein